MYKHARLLDFRIPDGKFYLADAGFALCDTLLTPYRGIRYHLAEWGRGDTMYVSISWLIFFFTFLIKSFHCLFRPQNKEEVFNLRHAQARNVVERIFGVVKKCCDILNRPPEYDLDIQAAIPAGLVALHNFILDHDETDLSHYMDDDNNDAVEYDHMDDSQGSQGNGSIPQAERTRAEVQRDILAEAMWANYLEFS